MKLIKVVFIAALALLKLACVLCAEPIIVGYYPDWRHAHMGETDLSKYTHINMGFVNLTDSGELTFDTSALTATIKKIQESKIKLLFSVGGWGASRFFSPQMSTAASRTSLANAMVSFVDQHGIDGIDIDWEYPGRVGLDCNIVDAANDTPNYLLFLKELRSSFDKKFGNGGKLITMAVRVQPFDVKEVPLTAASEIKLSDFAALVDFANIMAYDINGSWGTTSGPNAPLNFEAGKGTELSVVSAIDAWTQAGWPANKLTLGIAFYGRSTNATVDMTLDPDNQYQPILKGVAPTGDNEDVAESEGCGKAPVLSGVWRWTHLRDQNILTAPNTAASPWIRKVDNVTKTPWLFNPVSKAFISYDDPDSIKAKVDYAASKGLAGTMVWSIDQDYNSELVNVLHTWGNPATSGVDRTGHKPAESNGEDGKCDTEDDADGNGVPDAAEVNEKCDEDTEPNANAAATAVPANADVDGKCDTDEQLDPGVTTTSLSSAVVNSGGAASSAQPTNVSGSGAAGGSCPNNGEYQCTGGSSAGSGYIVCNQGKWVAMACGQGTVCKKVGETLYCGWP